VPLLSVVVPVHNVQGYLRECLDSILGQGFDDLELIAVDDASPDHSAAILTEYAARDPRLRIISLPHNEGLGAARNRGLAAAGGEYVWFVDSDDRLADGSLRAVARRLTDLRPDVLIVDFHRFFDDGSSVRSDLTAVLAEAPPVFGAAERPEVLRILHVAWNKIVRREFLHRHGLRFGTGWYEDVSYSYPALAAAERITVLGRVCVQYRQRRIGAITKTVDDRHFEIFAHWEQALAATGPALRPYLFARMIWHLLMVLGNARRVPRRSRRAFFHAIADLYARHRPADGYPLPSGAAGIKHRLVAGRRWRLYALLWFADRALSRTGRAVRELTAPLFRLARGGVRLLRAAAGRSWYALCRLLPRDPRLAVYASYWYRGVSGNPAAIHARQRVLAPQVRAVWVVRRDLRHRMPPGVRYVLAGSLRYYLLLARATYFVNDVNFPDLLVKRPGSVHLQTHHGTPLKVMGVEQARFPAGRGLDFPALLRRCDRWDFSVSANPLSTEVWERAYPCRYEQLETGYPRNDVLVRADAATISAARTAVGATPTNLVVLYLPTHRSHQPGYRPPFDVDELAGALGPTGRLLVRGHYLGDDAPVAAVGAGRDRVLDVSDHASVEQLYLAADVVITDYSSAMFDYAVLDRPIVIYAPDWAAYRSTRGVTFDLLAQPPGPVVTSFAGLVELCGQRRYDTNESGRARAEFRRRFCAWEDGEAADRVVRRVFLGEPVPSARTAVVGRANGPSAAG